MIRALKQLWRGIVVRPLVTGCVRPSGWPPVVKLLGVMLLIVFVLSVIHIIATPLLRGNGELQPFGSLGLFFPQASLPLVIAGIWLSTTLLHTAALHSGWFVRLLALLLLAASLQVAFVVASDKNFWWLSLLAAGLLLLLHLLRFRRSYSDWEPLVVGVLTALLIGAPLQAVLSGISFGFDIRLMLLAIHLQVLLIVAVIPLTVAGAALAQVSIQAGLSLGSVTSRSLSPLWTWLVLIAILAWRTFAVLRDLADIPPQILSAKLLWTLLSLSITALLLWLLLSLAGRHADDPLETLLEPSSQVSYLLVLGTTLWLFIPVLAHTTNTALTSLGQQNPDWLIALADSSSMANGNPWRRLLSGLGLLVVGVVLTRGRGRWQVGALAAAFAVPQALLLLTGLLPNWMSPDLDRSATALWLQISFTAAVILVAIRREFTRERARMLLTVGAVLVVHDLRFILDDPLSWVVGFSSVAVLLFGLTWRLLTDGEFTHADTKTLPRTTRVLLYLANAGFACTLLLFSTLTRDTTGYFDLEVWEKLGDDVFAPPLLITVVLLGLAKTIAPDTIRFPPPPVPAPPLPVYGPGVGPVVGRVP
ncbi:hypothetical protein [Arachnia propionica]